MENRTRKIQHILQMCCFTHSNYFFLQTDLATRPFKFIWLLLVFQVFEILLVLGQTRWNIVLLVVSWFLKKKWFAKVKQYLCRVCSIFTSFPISVLLQYFSLSFHLKTQLCLDLSCGFVSFSHFIFFLFWKKNCFKLIWRQHNVFHQMLLSLVHRQFAYWLQTGCHGLQ